MPKRKDPNAWFERAKAVTEDPAASDWLKNALIQAINRDPNDAAADADLLSSILNLRVEAAQRLRPSLDGKRKSPQAAT